MSLPLTWPEEEKTKVFARCAGDFFVWAQTMHLLGNGSGASLGAGPCREFHGRAYAPLDKLYDIALEDSIPHGVDLDDQLFMNVVGTIGTVATRDPLPRRGTRDFLTRTPGDVSLIGIKNTIECLGSVLYEDIQHDGAVRICHPSLWAVKYDDSLLDS